jgi:hypothetical protein
MTKRGVVWFVALGGLITMSSLAAAQQPKAGGREIRVPTITITGPHHVIVAIDVARLRPAFVCSDQNASFTWKVEESTSRGPF